MQDCMFGQALKSVRNGSNSVLAEYTHHLVIPSSMAPEVIIAYPVCDVIMAFVPLNLRIVYSTRVVMMPYQVSIIVKQQYLIVY